MNITYVNTLHMFTHAHKYTYTEANRNMTTKISTKRIGLIVYTRLYIHICVYVYVCVYLHVQINRNMTTNIEETNRRIVNLQQ